MIRWIFARSTICLPTRSEPTSKDNIKRTIESSISVKDFLRDKELKLLSLSLSLAARRDNNIIKKFHKTSKIKNRKIMFVKSYLSRGCAVAGLDLSRTEVVGSGRACQRPRTSSVEKCFSCEGALT